MIPFSIRIQIGQYVEKVTIIEQVVDMHGEIIGYKIKPSDGSSDLRVSSENYPTNERMKTFKNAYAKELAQREVDGLPLPFRLNEKD